MGLIFRLGLLSAVRLPCALPSGAACGAACAPPDGEEGGVDGTYFVEFTCPGVVPACLWWSDADAAVAAFEERAYGAAAPFGRVLDVRLERGGEPLRALRVGEIRRFRLRGIARREARQRVGVRKAGVLLVPLRALEEHALDVGALLRPLRDGVLVLVRKAPKDHSSIYAQYHSTLCK